MLPVEIVPVDGTTIVLRARGSELLILPQHIGHLKGCKNPKDFTGYFLSSALLNRPARKLFEAWLRKDKSLWQRIYRTIQAEMDLEKIKDFQSKMDSAGEPEDTIAPKVVATPKAKEKEKEKLAESKPAEAAKEKVSNAKKIAKPAKKTPDKEKAKKTSSAASAAKTGKSVKKDKTPSAKKASAKAKPKSGKKTKG